MVVVVIQVPVRANDGTVFPAVVHRVFEEKLVELFGGWSVDPLPIRGEWLDKGTVYKDECFLYNVFLASLTLGDRVGSAAAFARALYAQETIAIRYLGLAEIL